ncbi:cyclin-dependent kinase F-4 isoform X1 [Canna indica]|uniref:cyclin-dependent kinase n=1 Tax=Canna indica TaxID=4628 RepID=A0AAQ3L220_9LILI|nr:cyclin-dependent kinase F-4 isoform X1 [Canna indica]
MVSGARSYKYVKVPFLHRSPLTFLVLGNSFHGKRLILRSSLRARGEDRSVESLKVGLLCSVCSLPDTWRKYKVIKEVGDGTFGTVCQAINKQSGQVVAIKKMKRKYCSWEECLKLREVKSLRRLNHPNIIKLKEVIRENDALYLVFEYMECNLYQLMKERGKPFTEVEIRNWCFQIFRALAYMHQRGYFHRDLKPENLLVTQNVLKIADFGLAREVSSKPPFTEYVATRWYRAPEILLQSSVYDSAVDMWAMGAIMAELFTLRPLFPGSSEADEIHKICSVIGRPNQNSWAEGLKLADVMKFQFPKVASVPLFLLIPSASKDAINLISSLCSWDSRKRPTAVEVLQHSFFQPCFYVPPYPRLKLSGLPETPPSPGMKGALESKTARRHSIGVLSNARLSQNYASTSAKESSMAGLQRKLDVDSEVNKNERTLASDIKPSRHQAIMRNTRGFLGRESQKASNAAEKLSRLTPNSNRDSDTAGKVRHLNPHLAWSPPVLKAGSWHRHNNLLGGPQEIPPTQTYYSRKVAG